MLYEDFDSITRTLGGDYFKDRVPSVAVDNLNPAFALRDYQKEALGRLAFYIDEYPSKQQPVHLLFNMATGSGKTIIMAGAMLHLYKKGYRNFVFFVNSTNIIEKTKANFLNQQSAKYLFADTVAIDGKNVQVQAVDNFSSIDPDGINVFFTTIQGLHARVHDPKENTLTLEDFDGREFVLLSDEAHHINALTRSKLSKEEQIEKKTWEGTVQKVMAKNTHNILLEFTATIDTQNQDIADKYKDKLVYRYDLAQFRADGFSKDINVAGIDFEAMDRALGAVLLSQYRRKVAERNGLQLKPVVLMKSKSIKDSQEFAEVFREAIRNLKVADIRKFKKHGREAHKKAFTYFEEHDIALGDVVREVKDDFGPEKCISVNSKDDSEEKQLLVNSLEDKANPVRLVFAVDKLNEGWDVLNLFDIVRLYETRQSGGKAISPATMAEAQLIGRGARYWPFALVADESDMYVRKFDGDLGNELRVLEELYYHTKYDSRYIAEVRSALVKTGALPEPENVREYDVKVKENIKKTRFWKEEQIFVNEKNHTGRKHIQKFTDIPGMPEKFVYDLHKGGGREVAVFGEGKAQTVRETTTRDIALDGRVWRAALYRLPFYRFNSLKHFFPNIESVSGFIDSKSYLGGVALAVRGEQADVHNITREDELAAALYVLRSIEDIVQRNTSEYEGSKTFVPKPVHEVVKDKHIKIVVSEAGMQEFGVPMAKAKDPSLQLDLNAKDWYVYDENYGTREEKEFVKSIHDAIDDLQKRYAEVYVLRNEGLFKLYRFSDGAAVEPDFVLTLREEENKNATVYQLFVEPKGGHLRTQDQWKEDFLKEVEAEAKIETLFENTDYRIVGVPFYTYEDNAEFEEEFKKYMR